MHPTKVGAAPVGARTTPVELPSATNHGSPRRLHSSAQAVRRSSVAPHTPVHFPVRTSNAAAWALFTLVVGTFLIAACVVLTLGWPS